MQQAKLPCRQQALVAALRCRQQAEPGGDWRHLVAWSQRLALAVVDAPKVVLDLHL